MPNNNPDASKSTESSSNNKPSANQSTAPSSNEAAPPYTLTEQDGRINVAFTSGPMQGGSFQIARPQSVNTEQPKRMQEEPSHPYGYLDGNGNEISKEDFDRLSAIEIAEDEARMERERVVAEAEPRT
jgi:hypothetical protein